MRSFLRQFMRDNHGIALFEFIIVFPFIFLLLFGGIEIARNILIAQKLEKAGYVLGDITSQYPPATLAKIAQEINDTELTNNVFPQLARIMQPFDDPSRQRSIITSVSRQGGKLTVNWQMADNKNALSANIKSVVNGAAPGPINKNIRGTAADFTAEPGLATRLKGSGMKDGDNVIIVEVFYAYQPILLRFIQNVESVTPRGPQFSIFPHLISKRMFFRPRNCAQDGLKDLPPLFPVITDPVC